LLYNSPAGRPCQTWGLLSARVMGSPSFLVRKEGSPKGESKKKGGGVLIPPVLYLGEMIHREPLHPFCRVLNPTDHLDVRSHDREHRRLLSRHEPVRGAVRVRTAGVNACMLCALYSVLHDLLLRTRYRVQDLPALLPSENDRLQDTQFLEEGEGNPVIGRSRGYRIPSHSIMTWLGP